MRLSRSLEESVRIVGEHWADSPYYADAEKWLHLFWDPKYPFAPIFDRMSLDAVLELACGHGRHAEVAAKRAGKLIVADIHEANLEICRQRLSDHTNVEYLLNNGYDYQPVPANSLTAIYCYDAMVHFSPDVVASYLADCGRVLVPGGHAFFHHSNYPAPLDRSYGSNPHARNHMTAGLFAELASQAGLEVVTQQVISWGGIEDLDCLSLVQRPA